MLNNYELKKPVCYDDYKKSKINLSPLGFENCPARSGYFCTPIGAKIIGWTGVDGIHFCNIRGFGDTVFSISPMNSPGDYVHPIAKSFEDFLRLLLSCFDTAAIEQAHMWNENQFKSFIAENPLTVEQNAALELLKRTFSLEPLNDPFAYIKDIQQNFDYRKLRFKKDYYEFAPEEPVVPTAPEWKVYFSGGFFEHHGRERPGTEIPVGKNFKWGGEIWHIPSVYSCSKGLAVDFCAEVEPQKAKEYIDKWDILREGGEYLTKEQRMQAESENPLSVDFRSEILLNGKTLSMKRSCGISYIPDVSEFSDQLEAKWILKHYGLDESKAWAFYRVCYPWATKGRPKIRTMNVTVRARPVSIPAARFYTPDIGGSVDIVHPITGKEYTLSVENIEQSVITSGRLSDDSMEYPTNFTELSYRVVPDISDGKFFLRDCNPSDQPICKTDGGFILPAADSSVSMLIIGGADGPTAIISGGNKREGKLRIAYSSLHFKPVDKVEWIFGFSEILREDISLGLLP